MMAMIDAEQMKHIVDEYIEETGVDVFTVYHIHDFLDECDVVDAEIVKHGKWMHCGFGKEIMCSVCGCELGDGWGYRYCPDCGAKMDL